MPGQTDDQDTAPVRERCRHQRRMRVLPQLCFECEALAGNPMFKGYKEPALPNPLEW